MSDIDIKQILFRHWGYGNFRPLQEDIIMSVINGHDTLALMPTGGGKSICFQVPALAKEGICIVVTPLIALMKDQVDNLSKKNIKAAAIYSGMHYNEIDIILDKCIYDNIKFLYVSPERLENEMFMKRATKMNVNLLAIDEAHCISQWGYDFRPPYLRIADLRKIINKTPVLALTATATKEVVKDIQEKLDFKNSNVFVKSFERKNLTYYVFKQENKLDILLKMCNKNKGSAIVYVRNRKKTRDIAEFLIRNNIPATYYHAGLDLKVREARQKDWMNNKTRIMVSTNAFGMGIDKPNVRFVVHMDIPDSIEAYFQEAGRAGRDEKKSFAVILYEDSDIIDAKKNLAATYPDLHLMKRIYDAICNYLQIPLDGGVDQTFDFDLNVFSDTYNFNSTIVFNTLRFLEKDGYLMMTEALSSPSKIFIPVSKDELYRFQIQNEKYDGFIKILLRSYGGLFNDFVKISEMLLAKRAQIDINAVKSILVHLDKCGIINYSPINTKPQIIFLSKRIDSKDLFFSQEHYYERLKAASTRLDKMIEYILNETKCRSRFLLEYFGEINALRCGTCDICRKRNQINLSQVEFDDIIEHIKPLLKERACKIEELSTKFPNINNNSLVTVIQWLTDNEKIKINEDNSYVWRK